MRPSKYSFGVLLLLFSGTSLHAQFTQWNGLSTNWNDSNNWTSGIPTATKDARISVGFPGYFDPYVPAPFGGDTAKCKNFQVQSGGYLHFADGGLLVVYGTDKLQNDGSVFLGNGKIIFKNNITFLQGGTFDAGSGTLDFQGVTWDNKAGSTFISGTSNIILEGTSAQTVKGDISFYNIEVANTSGAVTFSGNVTITNSLVIDPGVSITLSSGSLTLTSTASLDMGEGSTLTVNGTFNNNGTITGSGTILSSKPLLNSVIALSQTSIEVTFSEAVDAASSQTAVNYSINKSITVNGAARDASNHAVVYLSVSVLAVDTSYTVTVNSVIDETGTDTIGTNSQKSFAYSQNPVPVQLSAFMASGRKFDADLYWSTATEINNYGFEVERRGIMKIEQARLPDGQGISNWTKVGFVAGAGTSNSPHEYSYVDRNLSPGGYAYRIRQIDNDGSHKYYGSAEVEIGLAAKEFKLESNYPNPFNPSTTIEFTVGTYGHTSLRVYNMLGQEVATLFDGEAQAGRIQQVKFDASKLPSGLYFAKLEGGKQQMMKKMVVIR